MQVPQTGYVSFTLVPSGTPIGQGGIIPANNLGLASVTIVKQPGNQGVYGIPPPGAYTGDALFATYTCFHSQGSLHAVPAMPSAYNKLPVPVWGVVLCSGVISGGKGASARDTDCALEH